MNKNVFYYSNIYFIALILLTFPNLAKSDLPVHCLVSNIEGEWTLKISNETFDAKVNNEETACRHGLPDKVDQTEGDIDFSFPSSHDITITLTKNYEVYESGSLVGNWTPVYDQSFLIYYKNSVLTAPYKYYKQGNNFVSNCNKSMLGWFVPDKNERTKNWSCFYALKKDNNSSNISFSPVFLQLKSNINSPFRVSFAQITKISNLHKRIKYEHLHNIVNEINNANLLWTADIHDQFRGLSLLEVRNKMGLKKSYKNYHTNGESEFFSTTNIPSFKDSLNTNSGDDFSFDKDVQNFLDSLDTENNHVSNKHSKSNSMLHSQIKENNTKNYNLKTNLKVEEQAQSDEGRDKDSKFVTDHSETIKYLNTPLELIDDKKLPRNWDWRNVGGVNYIPEVKNQGHCGSCYTFSSMTCLEARLRIQTNNQDQTRFSVQFPLACNFYSEGCDGGYPVLVAKFLHEFEVVPEECFHYTATNSQCSNVCDYTKFPKKYRVSQYGYLGGYYGATSEDLMIKELRARGPIPANLRVPYTLGLYKRGIYSEKELRQNSEKLSKTTLADRHLSWEKVEHSVTLVGYGEEEGVKYWILMNTWGPEWGESGFFRILRGENDCSVETMGDYFQIEVTNR